MTTQEGELLLRDCGKGVYGLCMRLTGNRQQADDLFQDTFVAAMGAKLPGDTRERSTFNWLYTICLNTYRSHYRKMRTRMKYHQELDDYGFSILPAPEREQPESAAARSDRAEQVRQAVLALPETYRMPIVLFYYAGMDTDAIAKALGIPSATVRTRMHRARKKLAEVLQPDFLESSCLEVSGRVQPCES